MVKIVLFLILVPLPGACNLDFPLENDPNLHMYSNHFVTLALFEYGDVGILPGGQLVDHCEDGPMQDLLEYDVYVHFMDQVSDVILMLLTLLAVVQSSVQKCIAHLASFVGT